MHGGVRKSFQHTCDCQGRGIGDGIRAAAHNNGRGRGADSSVDIGGERGVNHSSRGRNAGGRADSSAGSSARSSAWGRSLNLSVADLRHSSQCACLVVPASPEAGLSEGNQPKDRDEVLEGLHLEYLVANVDGVQKVELLEQHRARSKIDSECRLGQEMGEEKEEERGIDGAEHL